MNRRPKTHTSTRSGSVLLFYAQKRWRFDQGRVAIVSCMHACGLPVLVQYRYQVHTGGERAGGGGAIITFSVKLKKGGRLSFFSGRLSHYCPQEMIPPDRRMMDDR